MEGWLGLSTQACSMFAQQQIWARDFGMSFQKRHWYGVLEPTCWTQECLKICNYVRINTQWSVIEPYFLIHVVLHLCDQTNTPMFRYCFCCRWNPYVHNQHWVDLTVWWLKLASECHWLYNSPAGAFEILWVSVEGIFSDFVPPTPPILTISLALRLFLVISSPLHFSGQLHCWLLNELLWLPLVII